MGLWTGEWAQGIADGSFTKKEIVQEFKKYNIEIPPALMKDFEHKIKTERIKYLKYVLSDTE